jgi:hypothetical protein
VWNRIIGNLAKINLEKTKTDPKVRFLFAENELSERRGGDEP